MTVFNDIRAALEGQISTVTGIPSAANRAWENVRFAPTTGTAWVRMTLQPTRTRPAVAGPNPQQRYQGLMQVDLFVPEGNGPADADALADNIRLAFVPGEGFTVGTITVRISHSEREQGRQDGPWYTVPVFVSWYTYAP